MTATLNTKRKRGRRCAAHATARTLRAAIEAATTPEELDTIAWPT